MSLSISRLKKISNGTIRAEREIFCDIRSMLLFGVIDARSDLGQEFSVGVKGGCKRCLANGVKHLGTLRMHAVIGSSKRPLNNNRSVSDHAPFIIACQLAPAADYIKR